MAFYYIDIPRHAKRISIIRQACERLGVEFVFVNPETFDFNSFPQLTSQDFLFRRVASSENSLALQVEKVLLNDQVTTFYTSYEAGVSWGKPVHVSYSRLGVPIPRTVFLQNGEQEKLRSSVEYVGGFPLVVKILGYSRGRGVHLIRSWEDLVVMAHQFFRETQTLMLREYIDVGTPLVSHRAIVLGREVVFAYSVIREGEGEFRSNAEGGEFRYIPLTLLPEEQAKMVTAVSSLGLELGAVDFVRRPADGSLALLEVNFPFNFTSPWLYLKYDLPLVMTSYLQHKSRSRPVD